MPATIEQINRFPGFAKLTPAQKQALTGLLDYREITRQTFSLTLGDFADSMFFLLGGTVEFYYLDATEEKIVTYTATAGEIFGEVGVLHGKRRTAYAEVKQAGAVLELTDGNLDKLLECCPEVGRNLMERMAFRLANVAPLLEGSFRPMKEFKESHRTPAENRTLKFVRGLGSFPAAWLSVLAIIGWISYVFFKGDHDFTHSPYALLGLILSALSFVFSILILVNQNRETREQGARDDRMDALMHEIRQNAAGANRRQNALAVVAARDNALPAPDPQKESAP